MFFTRPPSYRVAWSWSPAARMHPQHGKRAPHRRAYWNVEDERAGWIDAKWDRSEKGQHVRVYRITPSGRKRLAAERTKWDRMTQAIAGILNPPRERES